MSFTPYTPRVGSVSRGASFVFDMQTLDTLKKGLSDEASANSHESELAVAKQFEALFIQQLLKQARQSNLDSGLWSSDQTKMITSIGDEQMAMEMASGQGMGLAQALVDLMNANKLTSAADMAMDEGEAASRQTSRLPHLKSSISTDGTYVAESISDLLEKLGQGAQHTPEAVKRVISSQISPISTATDKVTAFIDKMRNAVVAVAQKSGIPAELIMSQAALESGWGQREIRDQYGKTSHNLFGIKATGNWQGQVVDVMTTEFVDGKPRKVVQPFRAYESYEASLHDYARLISENPRYEAVLNAATARHAAVEIQKAGYATDPKYAEKLIGIMSYFQPAR